MAFCDTLGAVKDELLKARVSDGLKRSIQKIAEARGEAEAVIIREALSEYVLKDERSSIVDLTKTKPVNYSKRPPPKRKAG